MASSLAGGAACASAVSVLTVVGASPSSAVASAADGAGGEVCGVAASFLMAGYRHRRLRFTRLMA
jgi:hypothetical protein